MQHRRSWHRGIMLLALCGALFGAAISVSAQSAELEEAKRLVSKAGELSGKGNYDEALPLAERALAIFEKELGKGHVTVARMQGLIASFYLFGKEDYSRAETLNQRALLILEKVLGPEHIEVAALLGNHAWLYYKKGDYARAEAFYQRTLMIFEKAGRPASPDLAALLNNIALFYDEKGDYERAAQFYERASVIYGKTLGPEHARSVETLANLAISYYRKGDYVRAEQSYHRALAMLEKALGPMHPSVAKLSNNLGVIYRIKGDYVRAEQLFQRALGIYVKSLGPENPTIAESLMNLGTVYLMQSDYARAEQSYQRALAMSEKALGPKHSNIAEVLGNLSALYVAKGDLKRAIDLASRNTEIREHNLVLILTIGSEKQKRLYLDTLSKRTFAHITFNVNSAPDDTAATRLTLTAILRRKGRALDAMTDQIAALRSRSNLQDQKLLDQLANARTQLANLQLGGADGKLAPEARRAQVANLEAEIEKLEAEISRRSAEFRAQAQPVTLERVQAALPADAALVEIFLYRPFNAKAKSVDEELGAARYVAYVLKLQGKPQFVELGEAAAIDANVEKLRAALRDPKRADIKDAARVVDEQVMRPVRGLLGATRRIFLSPDGALNLIPFAALVDERGKYLVEDYTLTYLTSGRDLLRLQVMGESKGPPLVLANPLYDDSGNSKAETLTVAAKRDVDFNAIDFSKVRYSPLPGTAEEATALSALMPGARLLTAAEATEAALKQSRSPRILHVATHGFFLTDQPRQVESRGLGLGTGASQSEIAAAPAGASRGENLLLRSGLILAGVNQRRSGTNEDGVLTAAEAAALDLWGTKLVVLSACETGLGDVKNGEGVYGLRRALVLAGSESQVMSLWQVSDTATRDLMKAYYTRLQQGEGRTEALRQVQLAMLNKAAGVQGGEQRGLLGSVGVKARVGDYSHPYYWASFIQSGAWSGIENKTADAIKRQ